MVPAPCQDGDDSRDLNPTKRLLERARSGDQRAFDQLFDRYNLPLMRWAHGRLCASARGQNETRDLVLISFSKAFLSLDAFVYRHDGSYLGYLHQILRNEIATVNRRWRNKIPNAPLDGSHPDPAPTPDDGFAGDERHAVYELALRGLSPKEQELIRMREMGLSNQEIAEEAGLSTANAARMAVARAIERLAKAVQGTLRERE